MGSERRGAEAATEPMTADQALHVLALMAGANEAYAHAKAAGRHTPAHLTPDPAQGAKIIRQAVSALRAAVQRAREEAAREERERCAKIADEFAAREQNHAHAASGGAAGVSAEIERAIRLSAITCDSCKRVAPKMDEIAAAIRRQPPGAAGNAQGGNDG